jgi:mRNA interferase MazF
VELKRFDVYLVALDPTLGAEIKKTRPCVVISPDEMNRHIRTVIVAPMTTQRHAYPTRVTCTFEGKKAEIVLDQIRTVDRTRLIKRLGRVGPRAREQVLSVLADLFAP